MFNVGAMAWREGQSEPRIGTDAVTASSSTCIAFALIRSVPRAQMLQLQRSATTVTLDLHLPTDQPGIFLSCRVDLGSQDMPRLRRSFHQTAHQRSSALAIGGMTLLLAVCGWIIGGAEGVHRALTGGAPQQDGSAIAHDTILQWFGARLLRPGELPGLFNVLAEVCHRAGLSRLPDVYCLPGPSEMNAYALGSPENAAIILTEGLLRGMTREEIAGILAHEVAHIRNNDIWTMSWAAALHRSIEWTSLAGLALLRAQHGGRAVSRPLAALLRAAPSIAQLLRSALSRTRELDADATALELTGDWQALIAALDKLERHHSGFPIPFTAAREEGAMRLLRSHPATSERVGALLRLA